MTFGKVLRQLRRTRELGIKQLAPELGVNYTYLSKIENEKAVPSEELIDRVAGFFEYDRDQLYLAADKVPAIVIDAIRREPDRVLRYLRKLNEDAAKTRG